MATQTASEMLKEIDALETCSETTVSASSETIVRTFVPFAVEVMKTTIKIFFYSCANDKKEGMGEMSLKPNSRVLKHFSPRAGSAFTVAGLKEYLLIAARYEKLKALVD